MTAKIEQGFLKINIDGFHKYLDNIGNIVDIFYKKNKIQSVNFIIQNHKLIIINPEKYITRVEIDPRSIFLNYNINESMQTSIKYFVDLVDEIFNLIKYKEVEFSRIGHAVHHIVTEDNQIQELQSKIFTTNNLVSIINDTVFEIPFSDKKIGIQKIISTPIDASINKKILLLNVDFFTKQNEKRDKVNNILSQSVDYFDNKLFDGLYE